MSDPLEQGSDLTEYDYGYLKGDLEMWPQWGAGFGVCMEWCKNRGYGNFGEPTERGLKAMEKYEQKQG